MRIPMRTSFWSMSICMFTMNTINMITTRKRDPSPIRTGIVTCRWCTAIRTIPICITVTTTEA